MKKLLAVFAIMATVLAGTALADTPSQLKFMAGPPGGNWAALGGQFADLWTKEIMPTTSVTGGGVSNIIQANVRKGDIGFTQTSMLSVAQQGIDLDTFKTEIKNAKCLANLYTQYCYFIMRKDFADKNGITSVDDIVNKKLKMRFATLKTGTSSEFVVKYIFSSAYGIDYRKAFKEWGGSVEYASYAGGADLIADNNLDIFAFCVGKVASIVMQIESSTEVVLLPMSEEAITKVCNAIGAVARQVDPGIYKSVPEGAAPVPVVGDYTCIVVRGDLDDEVVYKICKSTYENVETLALGVKDIAELDPANAMPTVGVVNHPGAAKYWAEAAAK